jgi:hypothetical protein
MASPAYRAHQQMHIHIGRISSNRSLPLASILRSVDLDGSGKLPKGCVSSDCHAPSVRVVMVDTMSSDAEDIGIDIDLPSSGDEQLQQQSQQAVTGHLWELQDVKKTVKLTAKAARRHVKVPVMLISVFVSVDSAAELAGKVRPFETARAAAAAVPAAAAAPYVLMVAAHRQRQQCEKAAVNEAASEAASGVDASSAPPGGSASLNPQGSKLSSIISSNSSVLGRGGFESGFVVTAMVRGASPNWIMEAAVTDDCFSTCPLPPQPS